jgi:hypothetical protein
VAFKIPYVYDNITKLPRTHTELILNHVNPNVRAIGQGEARRRKYKRLKIKILVEKTEARNGCADNGQN